MAVVSYEFGKAKIAVVVDNPKFILTNRAGNFFAYSNIPSSKFDGYFIRSGNNVFKILDGIFTAGDITSVKNFGSAVLIQKNTGEERFYMPFYHNGLSFSSASVLTALFTFDCRKDTDFRSFGRNYRIYEHSGCSIVEFSKVTDKAEDATQGVHEFKIFTAIKCNGRIEQVDSWVKRDYLADKQRSSTSERYVFDAIRIIASKVALSSAPTLQQAVAEANLLFAHSGHIQPPKSLKEHIQLSFDSLLAGPAFYAGLPWFYQFWSRDTLIAVSAADKVVQKRLIMQMVNHIKKDGRLPNLFGSFHPMDSSSCADSIGWLYIRFYQIRNEFSKEEFTRIVSILEEAIENLVKNYMRQDLIYSGKNQTWMDTSYGDNGREGFPIEIQALTLASINILWELTRKIWYKDLEKNLASRTKQKFFHGDVLKDLASDDTIRPNIFLAAYVYPKLLSKSQWIRIINHALKRLWLPWGGLATIDLKNKLFVAQYTGEDNKSYHRGDSWYWINNISAIVMHKLDPARYSLYINRIRDSSVRDYLFLGAVGSSSELSCANFQTASGCLSQAWSLSTLLELLDVTGTWKPSDNFWQGLKQQPQ